MAAARRIAFTMTGVVLAALGGCTMVHQVVHRDLRGSADRLEYRAKVLARDTSTQAPAVDYRAAVYSRDASDLAERAHELRLTLDDRHAGDQDVDAAFEQLSHSYQRLRESVEQDEYRRSRVDLGPVTDAYLDVERQIGGYRDNRRYASESDKHVRY